MFMEEKKLFRFRAQCSWRWGRCTKCNVPVNM